MPHRLNLMDWLNNLINYLTYAMFAGLGGGLMFFNSSPNKEALPKLSKFFIAIGSSSFAGILSIMIMDALDIDEKWFGPVAGFTGWIGADKTLFAIQCYLYKKFDFDRRKPDA